MKMKDRLVELLKNAHDEQKYLTSDKSIQAIADYLLANGVIVPPCKVGDKMYYDVKLFASHSKGQIMESTVTFINAEVCSTFRGEVNITFDLDCFGKTVFLTKEDAEKALKGDAEE